MTATARRGFRASHGFTLIEVLAALTIGSAVIIATAALINNVALNFDRRTAVVGRADQLLLAVDRIAADLGAARQLQQSADGGDATAAFNGDATEVKFVTGGAAVAGTRSEEVVSLQVERTDDVSYLVRRRARWRGRQIPFASVLLQDPVRLIEGQVDISFAFASPGPDGTLTWRQTWSGQQLLPRLVRLTIRDRASGADLLPGLQFAVRADAPIDCAQLGASAKCATGDKSEPAKEPTKEPTAAKDTPAGGRG
ncbi:prepilin-type N-terminal cleavage/methylation domain-containing protein [Bradyrhizobium tropiciagri]|uniref:PulJ/GspJ family protein n=1 Tax=Bradyrhizobium tropiciagri TaxID=312253 RepID=UPI001BA526D5|nr:prepilin-type N-terminal cleavage/methylation domain-containing protein [Bradyrhizobium tropiciagri]MBR0871359.1 prepilin-type N-terminal cleavage/methylation domain-containing protein [Bradyrhizobium tropiciagri]